MRLRTHTELTQWIETRRRAARYPVPVFRVSLDGAVCHGNDCAQLDMGRFQLVNVFAYGPTSGMIRRNLIAIVGLDPDGQPLIGSLTEALIVALPMNRKG